MYDVCPIFNHKHFPETWTWELLSQVHKTGDTGTARNYHSITLVSCTKVMFKNRNVKIQLLRCKIKILCLLALLSDMNKFLNENIHLK